MADTSKKYKVATNDFMSAGGDGFTVYKTVTSLDTYIALRDVLSENIQQSGHIAAQIQGRIKNTQNTNPDEPVTRAEFTSLLVYALGFTENGCADEFSDIPSGYSYAGAVRAAVKARLVSGYEDGSFRPDNLISREETAAMATRAIKGAGLTVQVNDVNEIISKFKDKNEISGWAKTSVAEAAQAGVISGKESGDFAPSDYTTRTEAEAILDHILSYIRNKAGTSL